MSLEELETWEQTFNTAIKAGCDHIEACDRADDAVYIWVCNNCDYSVAETRVAFQHCDGRSHILYRFHNNPRPGDRATERMSHSDFLPCYREPEKWGKKYRDVNAIAVGAEWQ